MSAPRSAPASTPAAGRSRFAPGTPGSVALVVVAAIVLRLTLFLGRGDYLAFDEGWYLLLARSLYTGDGYTLIGIPHITLSPLFPILAGGLGVLLDSWVWGGRIVAALASGLLLVPAWLVFRRLSDARTAFFAVLLLAVIPSMAPFVVPFWIGADLWVGAEPLLHLLLFTGLALWLKAEGDDRLPLWPAAGAAFGLAFLARPEAILTWGLLGLASLFLAFRGRSYRRLTGAVLMGIGFAVVAAPYWLHIHDVTGRWSLTGRAVAPVASALGEGSGRGGPAATVERMLWEDDVSYQERLYGLDDSGLRLRSEYWGVYPEGPVPSAASATAPAPQVAPAPVQREPGAEPPSTIALYFRAMGQVLPLLLWAFVIVGAVRPRAPGQGRLEGAVAFALLGTSLAVAVLVAVDPRTQLFLVPLLALYAARGFALLDETVRDRGGALRPGFLAAVLAGAAVVWMLGIHGQRLYRSLVHGSPHHVVGEQNRAVAEELDALTGEGEGPVASWHPALAVYADRDWRVLPLATLPAILRYSSAAGAEVVLLSAYYPPPLGVETLGTRYLILPVPEEASTVGEWGLRVVTSDSIRAVGALSPRPRRDP